MAAIADHIAIARCRRRGCIAFISGSMIEMRGPLGQQHSIHAGSSAERFEAHWAGFVESCGLPLGVNIRRRKDVDAELAASCKRVRREIDARHMGAFGVSFDWQVICMIDGERDGDPLDYDRRPTLAEIRNMIDDARRDHPQCSVIELLWSAGVRTREEFDDDFWPSGEAIDVTLATYAAR